MILELSADASPVAKLAAATVLYLHIGAGFVGLLSGASSAIVKKGSRVHRLAGTVFVVSMLIMALIGAAVSPYLNPPQWTNVTAGLFTSYLVVSGYLAGRGQNESTLVRWSLLTAAVAIAIGALLTAASAEKASDAGPAYVFAFVIALAAVGDLKLIARRSLTTTRRLARHLWRMSFSLAIAAGSLFLGQQQLFPESVKGMLFLPVLAVLAFMLSWIVRMRFARRPLAITP